MKTGYRRYLSPDDKSMILQRSRFVWFTAVTAVVLWLGAILFPPLSAATGAGWLSKPIYGLFGFICHQIPERSFFLFGHQLAVCSRCFGVYTGLLIGLVIYPLWRRIDNVEPLPRFWLFASMIPILLDWSLTILGIWENTFASRYITGAILGIACSTYILPAAIEIAILQAMRNRRAAAQIH